MTRIEELHRQLLSDALDYLEREHPQFTRTRQGNSNTMALIAATLIPAAQEIVKLEDQLRVMQHQISHLYEEVFGPLTVPTATPTEGEAPQKRVPRFKMKRQQNAPDKPLSTYDGSRAVLTINGVGVKLTEEVMVVPPTSPNWIPITYIKQPAPDDEE